MDSVGNWQGSREQQHKVDPGKCYEVNLKTETKMNIFDLIDDMEPLKVLR